MILVDTSVLVRFLRTASPSLRAVLASSECAICGVTRAELLHGARTPEDSASLAEAMNAFIQLPIPEPTWEHMGHHLATLRAKGLPMPFQDVLLATIAIGHAAELWTYDHHFLTIQSVIPDLKLFNGPTA